METMFDKIGEEQISEERMKAFQAARFKDMYRRMTTRPRPPIGEVSRALTSACLASVSLPVLAITLRYEIEQYREARAKADENYIRYMDSVEVSPPPLDR